MATKKVKSTGRFGARYGRRIKVRVLDVERLQKQKHECPSCTKKTLKRLSKGVWECTACGLKMAGGAYIPQTEKRQVLSSIPKETPVPEKAPASKEE